MMKKLALVLVLTLGLAPTALADSIDFNWVGGTWSWGGSGVLSGSASNATATLLPAGTPQGPLDLSFATGSFNGGTGTLLNPFNWGAGGFITFSNAACDGGVCLSGVFTDAQAAFIGGGSTMTFVGNFVSGTIDSVLMAALGLPATDTGFEGSVSMTFSTVGGCLSDSQASCQMGSGDLQTTPVPEPGSLVLLGTGMISLAGALRRRLLG